MMTSQGLLIVTTTGGVIDGDTIAIAKSGASTTARRRGRPAEDTDRRTNSMTADRDRRDSTDRHRGDHGMIDPLATFRRSDHRNRFDARPWR